MTKCPVALDSTSVSLKCGKSQILSNDERTFFKIFILSSICTLTGTDSKTHDIHHVAKLQVRKGQNKLPVLEAALRLHLIWKENSKTHKCLTMYTTCCKMKLIKYYQISRFPSRPTHLFGIYSRITHSLQLFPISFHSYRFCYKGYFPRPGQLQVSKNKVVGSSFQLQEKGWQDGKSFELESSTLNFWSLKTNPVEVEAQGVGQQG